MRSLAHRDAWADILQFLKHAAKPVFTTGNRIMLTARRWSPESAMNKPASWFGEWPSECSTADFDEAVRLATERFGEPKLQSKKRDRERDGTEAEQMWLITVERAEEVLDFLDQVPNCTGGEWAPVYASYSCLFYVRDVNTGKVIPRQGAKYYPTQSWLDARLQRQCTAGLDLVLPFAEPDDRVADYVVALQQHLPVWLDPRYFDHMTVSSDGSRFHPRRLSPTWLGVTPAGEPRLDASRSGITPLGLNLPTDAELAAEDRTRDDAQFQVNFSAVANAMRKQTTQTLLIRGPGGSGKRYMVEQAAAWLATPLHVIETYRDSPSPSFVDELRAIVAAAEGRPAFLLVDLVHQVTRELNAAVRSEMTGRVLLGVDLPSDMRLIVAEDTEVTEAIGNFANRAGMARDEGFASREQLEFLDRQESRAKWREVTVELL